MTALLIFSIVSLVIFVPTCIMMYKSGTMRGHAPLTYEEYCKLCGHDGDEV